MSELKDVRFTREVTANAETDWGVCMYTAKYSDELPAKIRENRKGNRCYFFATGTALPSTYHVDIDLAGEWKKSRYGLQFAVRSYEVRMPTEEAEIEKFLASGAIKHLGKVTAKNIVAKFGKDSLRILSEEPEKLLSIRGIGEKNLAEIKESTLMNQSYQVLSGLLTPLHISPDKMTAIYKQFGDDSAKVIEENPYCLKAVKGFGFLTADRIAKYLGVGLSGLERMICCMEYTAGVQNRESGHMYSTKKELLTSALKTLNDGFRPPLVSERDLHDAFDIAVVTGRLIHRFPDSLNIVYLPEYDEAERESAKRIAEFARRNDKDEPLETEIGKWMQTAPFTLTKGQEQAIRAVASNRLSVITGGAGTGKTTITKAIIESYEAAHPGKAIHLLAPTSKAARRMKEATGREAHTIHSALKMKTGEGQLEYSRKLEAGLVIVDEFSMVDSFVTLNLFKACDKESTIVLIGDVNQLPSVGPGCVLSELIRSEKVCINYLRKIMRQDGESPIIANSYQINDGSCELEFNDYFRFVKADRDSSEEIVLQTYMDEVSRYGLSEVAVLAPLRKFGDVCADALNEAVQRRLHTNEEQVFVLHGMNFCVGDRVIQTRNSDKASNGDVGFIKAIEPTTDMYGHKDHLFVIEFEDGETIKYSRQEMNDIDLAYALTVHKSQGSEYKSVIIPLLGKSRLYKRNLLYTAVTRAKEKVTIIGDCNAINTCILTEDSNQRRSLLANRIYLMIEQEENKKG